MNLKRKVHNFFHPEVGRILMFHCVAKAETQLAVTPSRLVEILRHYKESGYEFIRIGDVPNHHASKFICLTFDDGYLDTMTTALPVLKEFNVPFCVYLTTNLYVGKEAPSWIQNAEMLNTQQVQQLATEPLCTIGGHTISHPRLSALSREQQVEEILLNKKHLESLIGNEIEHFAYPHGDYNQTTIEIVREAGYKTAVTCSGRCVRNDSKMLELDRIFAK